jgi:hypothetical protein
MTATIIPIGEEAAGWKRAQGYNGLRGGDAARTGVGKRSI